MEEKKKRAEAKIGQLEQAQEEYQIRNDIVRDRAKSTAEKLQSQVRDLEEHKRGTEAELKQAQEEYRP